MKSFRRAPLMLWKSLLLLIMLLLLAACSGGVRRLSSFDQVGVRTMMTDLGQAQVVFAGEFHDQRDHHTLQLQIIREMLRQGKKISIGFEMFDLEKQPVLDEWVRGNVSLQEFVSRYSRSWSINWSEYDEIMLFARNNSIPMVALDAPAELVNLVTRGGGAALSPAAWRRLPPGTTTAMLPSYRRFMSRAFRTHSIPDAMFDNFCAAQGLRNSTMARRIISYLADNPQRMMIVIAGVGHAMRRAVPADVSAAGLTTRIVIPQAEGLYDELQGSDMDYFVLQ